MWAAGQLSTWPAVRLPAAETGLVLGLVVQSLETIAIAWALGSHQSRHPEALQCFASHDQTASGTYHEPNSEDMHGLEVVFPREITSQYLLLSPYLPSL